MGAEIRAFERFAQLCGLDDQATRNQRSDRDSCVPRNGRTAIFDDVEARAFAVLKGSRFDLQDASKGVLD